MYFIRIYHTYTEVQNYRSLWKFSSFQKFVISTASRITSTNLLQRPLKKNLKLKTLAIQEVLYQKRPTTTLILHWSQHQCCQLKPGSCQRPQQLCAVLPAALCHRGTFRTVLKTTHCQARARQSIKSFLKLRATQPYVQTCAKNAESKLRSSTNRILEVRNPS